MLDIASEHIFTGFKKCISKSFYVDLSNLYKETEEQKFQVKDPLVSVRIFQKPTKDDYINQFIIFIK